MKIALCILGLLNSIFVLGQENGGRFITDHKSGCNVWDAYYSPEDSISWAGSCKDKMANGTGTLIWFDHGKEVARYEGIMQRGNPNGIGKYQFAGGGKMEGNFVDGVLLNLEEVYLKKLKKHKISGVDSTGIFANNGGEKELFYYALVPEGPIKGVLVLLPSSGERPEEVFSNNVILTERACDNNLLTIIPSVNSHVCFDTPVRNFLNAVFSDAILRYKIPKDKFILGGLSLGGMFSLRYTEMAYAQKERNAIVPKAVYGVDPPLDLANLYGQFERDVERNFSPPAVQEAKYYLEGMNKMFGGTPKSNPDKYILNSIYSRDQKDGGNAKHLINVPVRIYSDPDIDWQLKNKHRDYYDMNAPDQTAMINQLILSGNTRAEFINALGKGYRLDGSRHPHSWSIVEPGEFIIWAKKCIQE